MPELVQQASAAWRALTRRPWVTLFAAIALALAAVGILAFLAPQPGAGALPAESAPPGARAVAQEPQSPQIELRAAVEREIDAKVGRVLEPLVGPDGFVVRTTAELDFTRVLRRETSYDPDSGVLLSEERTKEKSGAADVPERQNQRASWEYSKRESSIEQPVGQLQRLSVAVLVDQRRSDVAGEEGAEQRSTPRSDEELAQIEGLVQGAIGFDAQRGDRVTVEQVAFQRPAVGPAAGGSALRSWLSPARWPVLVALALIALFLLVGSLVASRRPAAAARQDPPSLPTGAGSTAALGRPSPVEAMRQQLAAIAAEQPEGMAQTLRIWLHEAQGGTRR